MEEKRGPVLLLIALLLIATTGNVIVLMFYSPSSSITGKATTTNTGEVTFCIDRAPNITAIADQAATAGTAFSVQVTASDNDDSSPAYYDNTSLFAIDQTGLISFTPSSADVGAHSILITVEDNNGCALNATDDFLLTIAAAAAEAGAATGGAGGGGATTSPPSEEKTVSFSVDERSLRLVLKPSRGMERKVTVANDGEVELEMEVDNPLSQVLQVIPSSFTLLPGQQQELQFIFNPRLDAAPDIYSGLVAIKGAFGAWRSTKNIVVVLEVETEEVPFDASIDLLTKDLLAGEELRLEATISVFNLHKTQPAEITITYLISGIGQSIVYEEQETLQVLDQVSFSKSILLPENSPPGKYLFAVKIVYEDTLATASELFTINGVEVVPEVEAVPLPAFAGWAAAFEQRPVFFLSLPLMLALIVIIIIVLLRLQHRTKKVRTIARKEKTMVAPVATQIKPVTQIKPDTTLPQQEQQERLKKKLALVQESYRKGYLSPGTYERTRQALEKAMRDKK